MEYFDDYSIKDISELTIKYRKLYDACKKYPKKQLSDSSVDFSRPQSFNIERNWETIAEGGFIENYCLSEEEVERLHILRKMKKES